MKSICNAFTKEKTDELYTPKILVEVLTPYIDTWILNFKNLRKAVNEILKPEYIKSLKPIIWLPFDLQQSEFVHYFKTRTDCDIVTSHIDEGKDFFEYEPDNWDIAISNPPFSRKLDVFKRLNSFNKPWAMVMNLMALNYQEVGNYFADNPIQLLIPDKKISFNGNQSSFNSCYVCKNFLDKDLQFVHVENNNTGKFFIPSRMYND